MGIRSLLSGCFGRSNTQKQYITGVDVPSEETTIASKSEEVIVKSHELSGSSSNTSSPAAPMRTTTKAPTKALCVVAKRIYGIATNIPYPSIEMPNEVIIRTKAVGLNPIDWKSVDYNFCMPSFPWIGGREVAGIVEEVGSNVTDVKVGDRVWASTYYRDRRAGTFQEFCVVPDHTVLPLPVTLSFESGACLGVPALTAAMTLWRWLGVPMPTLNSTAHTTDISSTPKHILIWGGSAVTGQFAIQLARQSGLCVIAVTSAKTKPLAERLGAEHVIARDGKTNDEIVADIRAITGDDLTLAIDIVGITTGACCLKALSTTKLSTLAPLAFLKDGEVVPENVTIAPIEMKKFIIELGNKMYAEDLNRLITEGTVAIPEIEVLNGGLEMVEEGLEMLKKGDMNGRKLVVNIA